MLFSESFFVEGRWGICGRYPDVWHPLGHRGIYRVVTSDWSLGLNSMLSSLIGLDLGCSLKAKWGR